MSDSDSPKTVSEIQAKRCYKCERALDTSSFYKNRYSTDGLQYACKDCEKYRHAQRKENCTIPTEKVCKECKQRKTSYQFMSDTRLVDGLSPKCLQCFWTLEARIIEVFHSAKYHSKIRSKKNSARGAFDLTPQLLMDKFLKQRGKCYISGLDLVFTPYNLQTLSIERLDNTQGELDANTVLVCAVFNHRGQMTREKLYYILNHNDTPMDDVQIEQNVSKRGVFENLSTTTMAMDRRRGIITSLTPEDLRAQFRRQQGRCAYSDVRMYVGANIPTFQMSIERVDRTKPHSVDNIVLIILELNIGGDINLSRDIVQSWKQSTNIPETFDIRKLRAKWDSEAVVSKHW